MVIVCKHFSICKEVVIYQNSANDAWHLGSIDHVREEILKSSSPNIVYGRRGGANNEMANSERNQASIACVENGMAAW